MAYLRSRDENDCVRCSFLMSKSRLAPVKAITIPRLELTAATVLVRIRQLLKKELDNQPDFMYYTDSKTLLRYIINERKKIPCICGKSRAVNSWLLEDTLRPTKMLHMIPREGEMVLHSLDASTMIRIKAYTFFGNQSTNGPRNHADDMSQLLMMIQKLRRPSQVVQRKSASWVILPATWLIIFLIGTSWKRLQFSAQRRYFALPSLFKI